MLFVFGSLPIIAVFLLAAELLGDSSKTGLNLKRWMSGSILSGMGIATVGMGVWVFSTPAHATTWSIANAGAVMYILGQALILVGAIVELFAMRAPETAERVVIYAPAQPRMELVFALDEETSQFQGSTEPIDDVRARP